MINLPLPKGFQRLTNFPLDETSVFTSVNLLDTYSSPGTAAYPGQIVSVLSGGTSKVYSINADYTFNEVGGSSITASQGITNNNNNIELGGTIDTTVDLNIINNARLNINNVLSSLDFEVGTKISTKMDIGPGMFIESYSNILAGAVELKSTMNTGVEDYSKLLVQSGLLSAELINTGIYSYYSISATEFTMGWGSSQTVINGITISNFDFKIYDRINEQGMVYEDDYSANYTDRSLVDKGYVDAQIASVTGGTSGTYTFTNGLIEENGGIVGLSKGNELIENEIWIKSSLGISLTTTDPYGGIKLEALNGGINIKASVCGIQGQVSFTTETPLYYYYLNSRPSVWGNNNIPDVLYVKNYAANYQPLDADLTAIAGLTGTTGFLKKTAANTWTLDTSTYSISTHNHSTLYQPLDADLTAIAALSGTSGYLKKTAENTWTLDTSTIDITASNGITKVTNDFQFGGILTKYTTITGTFGFSHTINSGSANGYSIINNAVQTIVIKNGNTTAQANIELQTSYVSSIIKLIGSSRSVWFDNTNLLAYQGDYSASFGTNTLITKGYAAATYQPLDADLTALSTLSTIPASGLIRYASGVVSIDNNTYVTSAHTHTFASLTSKPTTLSGYGITDAYTKTVSDTNYVSKINTNANSFTGNYLIFDNTLLTDGTASYIALNQGLQTFFFNTGAEGYGNTSPSAYVGATGFKTPGGTAAGFLKANGTVDYTTYGTATPTVYNLTSSDLSSSYGTIGTVTRFRYDVVGKMCNLTVMLTFTPTAGYADTRITIGGTKPYNTDSTLTGSVYFVQNGSIQHDVVATLNRSELRFYNTSNYAGTLCQIYFDAQFKID